MSMRRSRAQCLSASPLTHGAWALEPVCSSIYAGEFTDVEVTNWIGTQPLQARLNCATSASTLAACMCRPVTPHMYEGSTRHAKSVLLGILDLFGVPAQYPATSLDTAADFPRSWDWTLKGLVPGGHHQERQAARARRDVD